MTSATRSDWDAIVSLVPPGAKVLDLGCGDGALLDQLVREKQVEARGVELSEESVRAAIRRGLSVRHGNIEEGLADYPDKSFDYVILSQTLAYLDHPVPVVRDMLRVGRHAIISFEHAGNWRLRARALCGAGLGFTLASGQPRVRAITLEQFEEFCRLIGARIEKSLLFAQDRTVRFWPNIRTEIAVYMIALSNAP